VQRKLAEVFKIKLQKREATSDNHDVVKVMTVSDLEEVSAIARFYHYDKCIKEE